MKALVTGGGGFLGGHIVEMLHQRGDDVTVLGRRPYPHLAEKGIATVQTDLCDAEAVATACEGMDVVFHVAAVTHLWGRRAPMWATNVDGTRHVIAGCRRHCVRRLVFTSTPSVVFGDEALCGVDESQPYPTRYLAHYPASKAEAERLVLQANDDDLHTVALRPHLMWGPGDPHLIPRIIERARRGKLVQIGKGDTRVDFTYIDNAANAHLLACDALKPGAACAGRPYFISQGEPVLLWPWFNELLTRLDVPTVRRRISPTSARLIGLACEWTYALLRPDSEPPMTRFLAGQLSQSRYFDISAARRDLGYEPTVSTAEGLDRLVAGLCGQAEQRA